MLPLQIFRSPVFAGINLATLALYAALSIAFFALPIYLSDQRGWGATQIGLAFLPFTLAVGLLSRLFGNFAEDWGLRRTMTGGILLAAIAFALFAATLDGALGIYLPMGLAGLGFALIIPPLTATALSAAPDKLSGLASGVNNAASRTASMIGVALGAAFLAAGTGWPIVFVTAAALCVFAAIIVLVSFRSTSANPA
jgi:predicted MFS family arabinose efflux permease